MKNLLLLLITLTSLSVYAQKMITLECTHNSKDNWALGGENLEMRILVNRDGSVLSSHIKGQKLQADTSRPNLFHMHPKKDDQMCGTGGCVKIYGITSYDFYSSDFNNIEIGEIAKVSILSSDYMASYEEDLDCKRIH